MIKLFTHVDLDGIGCAILGKLTYEDINIEFVNYNDVDEKVSNYFTNEYSNTDDRVYITDISVNDETAKLICRKINDNLQNIYLIDHHATAIELNQYEWAFVESEREGIKNSGTSLFYEHLTRRSLDRSKLLDQFVELVRSYDTWDWIKTNNQLAKDLNDVLHMIGRDDFIDTYTDWLNINLGEFKLDDLHVKLLKYKRQEIELYIQKKVGQVKIIKDKNYHDVAIVTAELNLSELGTKILDTFDIDYVAMFTGVNYSLRSKGEFDVSSIAKEYGGGGHKNAAGFSVDDIEIHKQII